MPPLYLTIPRGRHKDIKAEMDVDDTIIAPVATGDTYGTLRVTQARLSIPEYMAAAKRIRQVFETGSGAARSEAWQEYRQAWGRYVRSVHRGTP